MLSQPLGEAKRDGKGDAAGGAVLNSTRAKRGTGNLFRQFPARSVCRGGGGKDSQSLFCCIRSIFEAIDPVWWNSDLHPAAGGLAGAPDRSAGKLALARGDAVTSLSTRSGEHRLF
jgi:hypothetical protein